MQDIKIIPFIPMAHLGQILSWYKESEVAQTRGTILESCCTPSNSGFCYIEDNICLAHFSLHTNSALHIGIVNYITLCPILKEKNRVIMKIFDYIMQYYVDKKIDSFEIQTQTTSKEVFEVFKPSIISKSLILERKVKLNAV